MASNYANVNEKNQTLDFVSRQNVSFTHFLARTATSPASSITQDSNLTRVISCTRRNLQQTHRLVYLDSRPGIIDGFRSNDRR